MVKIVLASARVKHDFLFSLGLGGEIENIEICMTQCHPSDPMSALMTVRKVCPFSTFWDFKDICKQLHLLGLNYSSTP